MKYVSKLIKSIDFGQKVVENREVFAFALQNSFLAQGRQAQGTASEHRSKLMYSSE